MAYIKRALRRRLLWTLVAAVLAATALTGCDDLRCPESDLTVDVDGASGVEACVTPANASNWGHLKVRNGTGAPITVWGPSTRLPWMVQTGDTVDITLVDPQPGDVITFKPDLQAGVTSAVLDSLGGLNPTVEWRNCTKKPTQYCLAGLAAKLLPEKVEIRHATVPVQELGKMAITVAENQQLASNLLRSTGSQEVGTLTLRQA
jgi:hypothetical protein